MSSSSCSSSPARASCATNSTSHTSTSRLKTLLRQKRRMQRRALTEDDVLAQCLVRRMDDDDQRQMGLQTLQRLIQTNLCEQNALGTIIPFGSYRLGTHSNSSDLDVLIVTSRWSLYDFFQQLPIILRDSPFEELHPLPHAHVPVLKCQFQGLAFDLLYCRLPHQHLARHFGRVALHQHTQEHHTLHSHGLVAHAMMEYWKSVPYETSSWTQTTQSSASPATTLDTTSPVEDYYIQDQLLHYGPSPSPPLLEALSSPLPHDSYYRITPDDFQHVTSPAAMRSLNGVQVTQYLQQRHGEDDRWIPIVRLVKEWAMAQHIYGFWTGIHVSLLVSYVLTQYPDGGLVDTVFLFFKTWAHWKYPAPIVLEPGLDTSHLDLTRQTCPILTPCHPCMNATYNIGRAQLRRIVGALVHQSRILQKYSEKPKWYKLWKPYDWRNKDQYIQMTITGNAPWRRFVTTLYTRLPDALEQTHPGMVLTPCATLYGRDYVYYYYMGVEYAGVIQLRAATDFWRRVHDYQSTHTDCTVSMAVVDDVRCETDCAPPKLVTIPSGASIAVPAWHPETREPPSLPMGRSLDTTTRSAFLPQSEP